MACSAATTWPGMSISGSTSIPHGAVARDDLADVVRWYSSRCARRALARHPTAIRADAAANRGFNIEPPALIVGQMPMQDADLVEREQLELAQQKLLRKRNVRLVSIRQPHKAKRGTSRICTLGTDHPTHERGSTQLDLRRQELAQRLLHTVHEPGRGGIARSRCDRAVPRAHSHRGRELDAAPALVSGTTEFAGCARLASPASARVGNGPRNSSTDQIRCVAFIVVGFGKGGDSNVNALAAGVRDLPHIAGRGTTSTRDRARIAAPECGVAVAASRQPERAENNCPRQAARS